jgi:hypothetical protein
MRLRCKLNRKGGTLSAEHLVMLLIIFVSTALVLFFLVRLNTIIGVDASDSVCAEAVREASFVNQVYGRDFAVDIKKCPTEHITIDGDKLQTEQDKKAKKILAESMRTCWQQWGSGELDLFKESGTYCHLCTTVHFENIAPINDFNQFLEDKDQLVGGRTYKEILTGYVSEDSPVQPIKFGTQSIHIDTSKDYAVLFWYEKEKDAKDIYQTILGERLGSPARAAGVATAIGVYGGYQLSAAGVALGLGTIASGGFIVGVAGVAGVMTFMIASANDDYYTLSATYLIPLTPEGLDDCTKAATVTRSP